MIRILVLGDPQTGKTSIVNRLAPRSAAKPQPSIQGIEHRYRAFSYHGQRVNFQLWDTSAKDQSNPALRLYYQQANIFFIVFSLGSYQSFEGIPNWILKIREEHDQEAIVFLIGNDSGRNEREVQPDQISQIKHQHKLTYLETSMDDPASYQELLTRSIESIQEHKKSDNFLEALIEFNDETPNEAGDALDNKFEVQPDLDEEAQNKNENILSPQNLTRLINAAVQTYLKPIRKELFSEIVMGKSNIRRIEGRLIEEVGSIRGDIAKYQIGGQSKSDQNPCDAKVIREQVNVWESVSTRVNEEKDRLNQLSANFETFKNAISEEIMQSRLNTQIQLDKLSEDIAAIQERAFINIERNNGENEPIHRRDSRFSELFSSQKTQASDNNLDSAIKALYDEVNDLKQTTSSNNERIDSLYAYLEEDFNLKRQEAGLLMMNSEQKDSSEVAIDHNGMINDLDTSIKRCIDDAENVFNNLQREIDPDMSLTDRANFALRDRGGLIMHSHGISPSELTCKEGHHRNFSTDALLHFESNSNIQPAHARVGSEQNINLGENSRRAAPMHPGDPRNLSLFKKAISNSQQKNHKTNPNKENMASLINMSFKKISSSEESNNKLIKVDSAQEFSLFPKENERMGSALESIVSNMQYEIEGIKAVLSDLKNKYKDLKGEFDSLGEKPFEHYKIEALPSEVHAPGTMSPNDDFSLVELKMFEKRVSNAQDEDLNVREYIKRTEKRLNDFSALSSTLSKTYWGTINLLAERCNKIETKIGMKNKRSIFG